MGDIRFERDPKTGEVVGYNKYGRCLGPVIGMGDMVTKEDTERRDAAIKEGKSKTSISSRSN